MLCKCEPKVILMMVGMMMMVLVMIMVLVVVGMMVVMVMVVLVRLVMVVMMVVVMMVMVMMVVILVLDLEALTGSTANCWDPARGCQTPSHRSSSSSTLSSHLTDCGDMWDCSVMTFYFISLEKFFSY